MKFINVTVGLTIENYKLSIALSKLYSGQDKGPLSTANIRKYVAQGSGKFYLDNKTQEDAEEFMHALEMALFKELIFLTIFRPILRNFNFKPFSRLFRPLKCTEIVPNTIFDTFFL